MRKSVFALAVFAGLAAVLGVRADGPAPNGQPVELVNVSYDATRELWQELNERFVARYEKETGKALRIKQSHGGSAKQAEAVRDGLAADVVTLGSWYDTDSLRRQGLIAEGWERRLPHQSLPYTSTIVFVVRKGNPKGVKDWPDLARPDLQVVTANPKTSGSGRLSFLAAWGSVVQRGGSEEDARAFVSRLYRRVPVLDEGARGATVSFADRRVGDVLLAWENEAHLAARSSGGGLEVIYPPISIRAEPPVAVVDAVVERKGTREAAEAYLRFLYTEEGQEVIARHHYRPSNPAVARRHAGELPELELFTLQSLARDWDEAHRRFFAEGGLFDRIQEARK